MLAYADPVDRDTNEFHAKQDAAIVDMEHREAKVKRETAELTQQFERYPEEFLDRLDCGKSEAESLFVEAIGMLFMPRKDYTEDALRLSLLRSKAIKVVELYAEENAGE
ncbi:MAG: hypothetical protein ACRCWJ_05930 [Casimicrobium sp.]